MKSCLSCRNYGSAVVYCCCRRIALLTIHEVSRRCVLLVCGVVALRVACWFGCSRYIRTACRLRRRSSGVVMAGRAYS